MFYSRIEPEGDLYIARSDGTGLRQLTGDVALDRFPHWSPDGAWISMFSNRGGKTLQIWKIRPDGGDLQQVTAADNDSAYAAWAPDGVRLAVGTRRRNETSSVFLVDSSRKWQEQPPGELPQLPVGPIHSD